MTERIIPYLLLTINEGGNIIADACNLTQFTQECISNLESDTLVPV